MLFCKTFAAFRRQKQEEKEDGSNEDQKPVQVPDLVISTEAEKARNEAAKMRRTMRKQRRENGF